MKTITSAENPQFKVWKSLHDTKGIKKNSLFLLSGSKIIREFLQHQKNKKTFEIETLIVCSQKNYIFSSQDDLILKQLQPEVLTVDLSSVLFDELDLLGTHSPLLVCKAPTLPQWNSDKEASGLEVLIPVGDPKNLGALIRSATAFHVDHIILLEEAANPFHPQALKASAGSILQAPLLKGPSVQNLTSPLYALGLKGESLAEFTWPPSCRLLIGEEGPGLPTHLQLKNIHIPMKDTVESLNVTVATSIALYDRYIKLYKTQ